ncbi:uncharacterized protein TRUGW13939_11074 [Talaromyces rugulosus]|uniref:Myb-like domain-containing protein n=1 Tax=Talaromyces rugulosus TaxID=121627 RepID=A0A7H8RBU1_TALRU|nr:uncharacterized protein TRUGW13939_11074 [Talaromyces rugulosus]QKX63902.1 hypothetical protein TRUGW13939_11074 [Talaromyces rugulosus]
MRRSAGGSSSSPPDESINPPQIRDMPSKLPGLHIAPLRQPVTRILNSPVPQQSEITPTRTKGTLAGGTSSLPERLPTLEELLSAARTTDTDLASLNLDSSTPSLPPKTILPAFINLQAVENLPYVFENNGSPKRRRLDVSGDHFTSEHLQLPVPQAQNDKKPRPFGPYAILNGLNEPPPNAALFPPIEPGSVRPILSSGKSESKLALSNRKLEKQPDKRELRLEEILDPTDVDQQADEESGASQPTDAGNQVDTGESLAEEHQKADQPLSPKSRGRSRKNIRKWTDAETTDLLKGVVKCGIGNWTAILQQPELNFNKRSASNLKDRFRVCCPWAYGAADPNEATRQIQDTLANALINAQSITSGAGGKILLPDPRPKDSGAVDPVEPSSSKTSESSPPKSSKQPSAVSKSTPSQSHKSKSTLSSMGIPAPYFTKKSNRRSRRPFTPAEDEALLKGYAVHGFQWTLIQQDTHLNLSHRKATDLRDRFRTKFPSAYREGGSVSGNSLHRASAESKQPNIVNDGAQPSLSPQQQDTPTRSSRSSAEKKQQSASEPVGLASIGSLLPPRLQNQSGMLVDANGSSGGVFSMDETNTSAGVTSSAESAAGNKHSSAGGSNWVDNTLPPLNWDDLT